MDLLMSGTAGEEEHTVAVVRHYKTVRRLQGGERLVVTEGGSFAALRAAQGYHQGAWETDSRQ